MQNKSPASKEAGLFRAIRQDNEDVKHLIRPLLRAQDLQDEFYRSQP